ncbi:hypothetical protein [Nonomuraea sp. NPDC049309]|uniref:hypothetical protein n=1 Tax=Nonomuraea sp. NPDC049309 TaxID=3364350 RepID=UPI003711C908
MSMTSLIDRECVRKLLDSRHPDATLVFIRGGCEVLPASEIDDAHKGLVIARRDELMARFPSGTPSDRELDELAHRLDNIAHDLGS